MIRNMRVVVLCACCAGVLSPTGALASAEMRSGVHEPSAASSSATPSSTVSSRHHTARAQARLPQAERQTSVLAMEDLRPVSTEAGGARLGFSRGERVAASRDGSEEGNDASPVSRNAVLIVGLGIALISIARRMGRY